MGKETQNTETRIFNHNRISQKDINFRESANIKIIYNRKIERRSKRINCIAEKIRENVGSEGKICEIKRQLKKKGKTLYSITNARRIELENYSDIEKDYSKYQKH